MSPISSPIWGVEWLDKQRDKEKPFVLFLHHKVAHRIWMSDTTHLTLFEDKQFELPENFYDDYAGRVAASRHEMGIYKDMDLTYDLKMLHPHARDTARQSLRGMGSTRGWIRHRKPRGMVTTSPLSISLSRPTSRVGSWPSGSTNAT